MLDNSWMFKKEVLIQSWKLWIPEWSLGSSELYWWVFIQEPGHYCQNIGLLLDREVSKKKTHWSPSLEISSWVGTNSSFNSKYTDFTNSYPSSPHPHFQFSIKHPWVQNLCFNVSGVAGWEKVFAWLHSVAEEDQRI